MTRQPPAVSGEVEHTRKLDDLIAQLRQHRGERPLSLHKQTVSHQVPKAHDLRHRDTKIDVGALRSILSIDPVRRICVAESGVTFAELVDQTLRHHLVPVVVPELSTITVGGAVSGCSLESMSFARGGFHDSCIELEVVTATGEVLTCRRDNAHRLVFEMMQGSFGTLGIITKVAFELVPAQPFVRVVYETHCTLAEYQDAIRRHFDLRDVDFMDGIIHAPDCYVLSVGRFVSAAPYTNRYDWLNVYYQSTRTRTEDYLRTRDYLFRYDRGVTNVRPRSFLGRLLFGKLMTSTRWLQLGDKLHRLLRDAKPPVTLDVFVPFSKVPEFMVWYAREVNHYPIWCVPYRRVRDYPWIAGEYWNRNEDPLFLDLAVYGMRQHGDTNLYRLFETELQQIGGLKTLIAHNYYTPDEFWTIYDRPNYEAVKVITDPDDQFRDIYEKTCHAAMGR